MIHSRSASNEPEGYPGALLTCAEAPSAVVVEPDSLGAEVAAIWKEVLEVEHVGSADNFFDLGGNSLRAVQALLAIDRLCERNLPVTFLYEHPTFGQLVAALERQAPPTPDTSLISIQQGTLPPLFWLPGATSNTTVLLGNAAYIFRLARALGPERTVYSVYQKHEPDSTFPTIEKMAAGLLRDVVARQPTGPYYLAGWSFGGLVAFEMARQLQRAGQKVALLAVVDQVASGYPRPRPWSQRPSAFWKKWTRRPDRFSFPITSLLCYLGEQATLFIRKFRRTLGQHNDWDRVIHLETKYLSAPHPYPGHVTLFVSPETLRATEDAVSMIHNPNLGWDAHASSVETHVLAGTHHTIFDESQLTNLTEILRQRMGPDVS